MVNTHQQALRVRAGPAGVGFEEAVEAHTLLHECAEHAMCVLSSQEPQCVLQHTQAAGSKATPAEEAMALPGLVAVPWLPQPQLPHSPPCAVCYVPCRQHGTRRRPLSF